MGANEMKKNKIKSQVKLFLSGVFVLSIILIIFGPGVWTLLVWLFKYLGMVENNVVIELYRSTFPKTLNPWIGFLIFLSTLLTIILILAWVFIIWLPEIGRRKDNK